MAGQRSEIDTLFNALVNPIARQLTLPAGAAITLTANAAGSTYGNWADVALAATILAPTLIFGITVSAPSAVDVYTVDIGSCLGYANAAAVIAGGAGAIAAAHRAEVRVQGYISGAGGGGASDVTAQSLSGYLPLQVPVYIPTGVGIIGRCYGITAAAVTIDVSMHCVTGVA